MTVKDLIVELLNCNMNAEIFLCDDVRFINKDGLVSGTAYEITDIDDRVTYAYLKFYNWNHAELKEKTKWDEECGDCRCKKCGENFSDPQTSDGKAFRYCPMCGRKVE